MSGGCSTHCIISSTMRFLRCSRRHDYCRPGKNRSGTLNVTIEDAGSMPPGRDSLFSAAAKAASMAGQD
jgi:hypothetical protein